MHPRDPLRPQDIKGGLLKLKTAAVTSKRDRTISRDRERETEACSMFARHTEKCRAIISADSDGCDSSKLMGFVQRQTRISTMLDIFGYSSP